MQPSPQTAYRPMQACGSRLSRSRKPDELVYEAVTVAAILAVLGSLWVF